MDKATFGQAYQLLKLVQEKNVPLAQIEAALNSGALSDVLDGNFADFNRDALRATLGLTPLKVPKPGVPLYLTDTGIRHSMPACAELNVEQWVESLPKYDQGSNFRSLVKGRVEKNVPASQLRHFRNTRGANGADLVKEIKTVHGGKCSCFADIKTFIESRRAKKDGTWYVFLMEIEGREWLVFFCWFDGVSGRGWYLHAYRPQDCSFKTDCQFLFRDSLAA